MKIVERNDNLNETSIEYKLNIPNKFDNQYFNLFCEYSRLLFRIIVHLSVVLDLAHVIVEVNDDISIRVPE